MISSWKDPPYADEDQYIELCHNSKPSDFYFCALQHGEATTIAIGPKLFFMENGYMWDQSMDLDHIIPSDFFESMESVWSSDRIRDEVRKDLLARGFEENIEFENLVREGFDCEY